MATNLNRRIAMVDRQLRARGIRDERVLEAMTRVPRHVFVPEEARSMAYFDSPLAIGHGQTISQPYMVALMTEALELRGTESVLEIGTGSGYQTAVLCELADTVVSVERVPALAAQARKLLADLGYANVQVVEGDGTLGHAAQAPYDRILVTAGAPGVPQALREQLGEEGCLVIPVGDRWFQDLLRVRRQGSEIKRETLTGCVFVPLIGEQGWRLDR